MENHLNITKQFVPYELSVKLKELGFNEKCIMSFNYIPRNGNVRLVYGTVIEEDYIPAPLWQQAFDWFREKYGFDLFIKPMTFVGVTQYYDIELSHPKYCWDEPPKVSAKTYQEARQACLEKLIAIVEDKN